jgi:predicted N-acyltransferase
MDQSTIEVSVIGTLGDISQAEWDACARVTPDGSARAFDPFTQYAFLKALEDSGSVGDRTGWIPRYLIARKGAQVIGVMPLYIKMHSQGEYVFDHNWAHAYEQSGAAYYPKLQAAVPFTPASGRRLLARPGYEAIVQAALVEGAVQVAAQNDLSSVHITFCDAAEYQAAGALGLLQRTGQQFHWVNDDYADFDAFLADLSSRKRKNIRKERRSAQSFGGEIIQKSGAQITPEDWDAFWVFYQDTGARKWGSPYLTRSFFDLVQAALGDDLLLVLAMRDGRPIAGALNLIGAECLYGRYWGCTEHHNCLHFEICYYQAIDYAIANGLKRVEAGAQGQHKLARGYMPAPTYSLHWIADPRFRDAVSNYLDAERAAVDEEIEILTDYGPFKTVSIEEQD